MMELSSLQGSGRLRVQLIVDMSNPKDGDIIGNAEYRLSNQQISGAEQQGTMSPLGEPTEDLRSRYMDDDRERFGRVSQ